MPTAEIQNTTTAPPPALKAQLEFFSSSKGIPIIYTECDLQQPLSRLLAGDHPIEGYTNRDPEGYMVLRRGLHLYVQSNTSGDMKTFRTEVKDKIIEVKTKVFDYAKFYSDLNATKRRILGAGVRVISSPYNTALHVNEGTPFELIPPVEEAGLFGFSYGGSHIFLPLSFRNMSSTDVEAPVNWLWAAIEVMLTKELDHVWDPTQLKEDFIRTRRKTVSERVAAIHLEITTAGHEIRELRQKALVLGRERDKKRVEMKSINLYFEDSEKSQFDGQFGAMCKLIPNVYREIRVSEDNIVATTPRVIIVGENDGVKYDVGWFEVTLNDRTGALKINQQDDTKFRRSSGHPHISDSGIPCLGNIDNQLMNLIETKEYAAALALIADYLRHANDNDSYVRVANWGSDGGSDDEDYDEDEDDDNRRDSCWENSGYHDCAVCDDENCPHFDSGYTRCAEYLEEEGDWSQCATCSSRDDCTEGTDRSITACQNGQQIGETGPISCLQRRRVSGSSSSGTECHQAGCPYYPIVAAQQFCYDRVNRSQACARCTISPRCAHSTASEAAVEPPQVGVEVVEGQPDSGDGFNQYGFVAAPRAPQRHVDAASPTMPPAHDSTTVPWSYGRAEPYEISVTTEIRSEEDREFARVVDEMIIGDEDMADEEPVPYGPLDSPGAQEVMNYIAEVDSAVEQVDRCSGESLEDVLEIDPSIVELAQGSPELQGMRDSFQAALDAEGEALEPIVISPSIMTEETPARDAAIQAVHRVLNEATLRIPPVPAVIDAGTVSAAMLDAIGDELVEALREQEPEEEEDQE